MEIFPFSPLQVLWDGSMIRELKNNSISDSHEEQKEENKNLKNYICTTHPIVRGHISKHLGSLWSSSYLQFIDHFNNTPSVVSNTKLVSFCV